MRPVLKPALRRLWRDGQTVQLGVDPLRAVLIHDVTPGLLGALDLLDGTRRPEEVVAHAATVGFSAAGAQSLLGLLQRSSALDDAGAVTVAGAAGQPWRLEPELASLSLSYPSPGLAETLLARRADVNVLVVGAGRVGGAVARLLAAAGVGGVAVEGSHMVRSVDVMPGGFGTEAVGLDAAAGLPDLPTPASGSTPDLVILAPTGAGEIPLAVADHWRREGIPHLCARVRETTGVIGPLVLPGRTACLTCLHLHRADRDPRWPLLAVQLSGASRMTDPAAVALCTLVAAMTCQQALELLDAAPGAHPPACAGGTVEFMPPDWRFRRRSWPAHPGCGCLELDEPALPWPRSGETAEGLTG